VTKSIPAVPSRIAGRGAPFGVAAPPNMKADGYMMAHNKTVRGYNKTSRTREVRL